MAGRVDDVPRVEHAMDAVMMLTAVATRLGDRAGLVAFDREVRAVVPPGHGARPARPGDRGDVRARAASWPRATTAGAFADDPRPVPAPGHARACSPTWSSRRSAESLLPAPAARSAATTSWSSPACRTPRSCAGRATVADRRRRRLPQGRRGGRARRAPPHDRPPARPRRDGRRRARPASSPRSSPTPTSRSRPPAASDRPHRTWPS